MISCSSIINSRKNKTTNLALIETTSFCGLVLNETTKDIVDSGTIGLLNKMFLLLEKKPANPAKLL